MKDQFFLPGMEITIYKQDSFLTSSASTCVWRVLSSHQGDDQRWSLGPIPPGLYRSPLYSKTHSKRVLAHRARALDNDIGERMKSLLSQNQSLK